MRIKRKKTLKQIEYEIAEKLCIEAGLSHDFFTSDSDINEEECIKQAQRACEKLGLENISFEQKRDVTIPRDEFDSMYERMGKLQSEMYILLESLKKRR